MWRRKRDENAGNTYDCSERGRENKQSRKRGEISGQTKQESLEGQDERRIDDDTSKLTFDEIEEIRKKREKYKKDKGEERNRKKKDKGDYHYLTENLFVTLC